MPTARLPHATTPGGSQWAVGGHHRRAPWTRSGRVATIETDGEMGDERLAQPDHQVPAEHGREQQPGDGRGAAGAYTARRTRRRRGRRHQRPERRRRGHLASRVGRAAPGGRKAAYAVNPDQPMRVTLVPSAVSPAVGEGDSLDEGRTTAKTGVAVHGPTRTAASAPPTQVTRSRHRPGNEHLRGEHEHRDQPASGIVRSSSFAPGLREHSPTPAAPLPWPKVGASGKPSGTCTSRGECSPVAISPRVCRRRPIRGAARRRGRARHTRHGEGVDRVVRVEPLRLGTAHNGAPANSSGWQPHRPRHEHLAIDRHPATTTTTRPVHRDETPSTPRPRR